MVLWGRWARENDVMLCKVCIGLGAGRACLRELEGNNEAYRAFWPLRANTNQNANLACNPQTTLHQTEVSLSSSLHPPCFS